VGEKIEAQQATALLTGTIKDPTGAVVPDAKVTLKNSDTNIARTANSDKSGEFLFTLIPIGRYEVDVQGAGFSKYVPKGITLEINQNARLDVVLEVGDEVKRESYPCRNSGPRLTGRCLRPRRV
jgi:hypothetical protein